MRKTVKTKKTGEKQESNKNKTSNTENTISTIKPETKLNQELNQESSKTLNKTEQDSKNKETSEIDVNGKEIRIDVTSKIFSAAYIKPMYLVSIVAIAIIVFIISETSIVQLIGASKAYGISIVAYLIIMMSYVIICGKLKKKHNKLEYRKIPTRRKVIIYIILLLTALVVSILEPLIYILIKY
jgi:uncharacterized membrane protein